MVANATPHCFGAWIAHLFCFKRMARSKAAKVLSTPLDSEATSLLSTFSDL